MRKKKKKLSNFRKVRKRKSYHLYETAKMRTKSTLAWETRKTWEETFWLFNVWFIIFWFIYFWFIYLL